MDAFTAALASVLLVSLVSLVGIFTFALKPAALRRIVLYLVSFAAGALLGDAFLHLLPEISGNGFTVQMSLSVLAGIVASFILEKVVQWHHYHLPHAKSQAYQVAVMNLIGDGLHNFLDGLVIGGSYLASVPVGIATTIAVVMHEIPQEIGDFGVLIHGGFSKKKALLFNFLTALTAVAGALASFWLSASMPGLVGFLVPFAAGGFIYIAGTDLIPELHRHHVRLSHTIAQLLSFILGIAVMYALLVVFG